MMSGLETVGTCVLLVVLTIVLAVSMIWVTDRIGDWAAGKDDEGCQL